MEPLDPYSPPAADSHDPYAPPSSSKLKPLGSLAQSARGKEISRARAILIWIGVATMLLNGFMFFLHMNAIDQEIQKAAVAPAEAEEYRQSAIIAGILGFGVAFALGLIFLVFGLIVRKYPVPITITSLVLYGISVIFFAVINPETIVQGIIFKIIIISALIRAIRAAFAYDSETRKAGLSGDELLA